MARKKSSPKESRAKYNVTPEQFAEIWTRSNSAEEAAEAMGMPLGIVLARLSTYRKRGARLKKMPRKNTRRVDIKAMNRVIDEVMEELGQESPNEEKMTDQLMDVPVNILAKVMARKMGAKS